MKTVVESHDIFTKQVNFNQKFLQFSNDFNFKSVACQPYRPQTKGKVEALAKLTNRLDVYNGEFETIEELQEIVKKVMNDLNTEVSQATLEIPNERLKREAQYLNPLPSDLILQYYQDPKKTYRVTKESMINFRNKKFSVPTKHIGKQVTLTVINDELYIYYDGLEISKHKITNNVINYNVEDYTEILKQTKQNLSDIDYEKEALIQLRKFDLC